jgi:nitronate monooxygenase
MNTATHGSDAKRPTFISATGLGGISLAMDKAAVLLNSSEARVQSDKPRAPAWPNKRLIDLLQIDCPIVQAPMAGSVGLDMPVAVSEAGGLGSFPCALLQPAQVREKVNKIRARTSKPINLNFFCHAPARGDEAIEDAWQKRLANYYTELGVEAPPSPARALAPFGGEMCDLAVELKAEVVSFHFGLPDALLVRRLNESGCKIFSSATTVAEARWLEDHGADAVIAQGAEAGGHRGMFLTTETASQVGTLALLPQVVDAVKVPVIAAGGIGDGRGIAAAMALGASAVQLGTAYLLCPEALISAQYRAALKAARDDSTAITNVLTGRPARVIANRVVRQVGPIASEVPAFPLPTAALTPLRVKAEEQGSIDFSALYAGQAAPLGRELSAKELTLKLVIEALERFRALASPA